MYFCRSTTWCDCGIAVNAARTSCSAHSRFHHLQRKKEGVVSQFDRLRSPLQKRPTSGETLRHLQSGDAKQPIAQLASRRIEPLDARNRLQPDFLVQVFAGLPVALQQVADESIDFVQAGASYNAPHAARSRRASSLQETRPPTKVAFAVVLGCT